MKCRTLFLERKRKHSNNVKKKSWQFVSGDSHTRHRFKKSCWAYDTVLNISSFTRFDKLTLKFKFRILKLSCSTYKKNRKCRVKEQFVQWDTRVNLFVFVIHLSLCEYAHEFFLDDSIRAYVQGCTNSDCMYVYMYMCLHICRRLIPAAEASSHRRQIIKRSDPHSLS